MPHHFGRFETLECDFGASSWRLGESNIPKASANVGLSSIAPIVLPHTEQKARLDHSDERHVDGMPPVPIHST